MYCANCGKELPSTDARVCLECGTAVETEPICSKCGSVLPYFVKYCPKCGEKTKGLVFDILDLHDNLERLDLKNLYIKELDVCKSRLRELRLHNIRGLIEINCNNGYLRILDIQECATLERLECRCVGPVQNSFDSINVAGCPALKVLDCSSNFYLKSLNIIKCPELRILNYSGTHSLKQVDVTECQALEELYCGFNKLTFLDVSKNHLLTVLDCSHNELTTLDASNNKMLKILNCSRNKLEVLDVSNNTMLEKLGCRANHFRSLNVTHNKNLKILICDSGYIASLDIGNNHSIKKLNCQANSLVYLNVSGCSSLTYLACSGNSLSSLNVASCLALEHLDCSNNPSLAFLDLSKNISLTDLSCYGTKISTLDLRTNKNLKGFAPFITVIERQNNCNVGIIEYKCPLESVIFYSKFDFDSERFRDFKIAYPNLEIKYAE